ncbi:MAG: hypothetical protein IJU40_04490 [Desulfovibrionaceae bacterium]|nr:hypothetical protein [Desulfovibrionaceae bacterium]
MPCSEKRTRYLLESGRAPTQKMFPFTICLLGCLAKKSVVRCSCKN